MVLLKIAFTVVCIVLTVFVGGLALSIGDRSIGFSHVFDIVWNHINGAIYEFDSYEWWDDYIVFDIRMPRVVMGMVTGASLALGGVVMQSMLMNPLADPYTTGISSGACFGAVTAIVVGATYSTVVGNYGIVTNAFIGALVPAFIIILISSRVKVSPVTMILAGTAISYMFNALTTILMVAADEHQLAKAYAWQIGTLENAVWSQVPVMLVVTLVGTAVMVFLANKLDLLMLGDDSAKSLGLDVERFRVLCLLVLSFITASVIAYTGVIGFVGLIVPHIARIFVGSKNRYLIPASMTLGALTVVSADLLARRISMGSIPVGVVMSFIGGFVFLILVIRNGSRYGDVP